VHDRDVGGRQLHAGVQFRNRGVVPLLNLAKVDIGKDRPRELQLVCDTGNVIDGHDGAKHGRKVQDRRGRRFQLLVVHRTVGGTEEDGLIDDLLDAPA